MSAHEDPLAPARGVMYGLSFMLIFYAAVAVVVTKLAGIA